MIPLNEMWGTRNDCFMQCICKYEIIPAILWSPPPVFSHVTITVMSPSVAAPHPTWILPTWNMVVWKYWWHSLGTSHGCTSGKSAGAPCLRPDYIWPFCRAERIFPTYRAQYEESCLFLSFSTISPFFKYLYPEAGLLSQLVQGQLIKREKSSVRLSSCTAKSSVYCFNITNDKLGATDLHCLHNDWIFTTIFIRWVMTDSTL